MGDKNPVLYTYKGIKIRRCNRIVLRFGEVSLKKIIDVVDETGLSIQKVLAHSGKPCDRCKNISVIVFDKEGNELKIKRGILHVPENNGSTIIKRANAKSNKPRKKDK